MKKAIFLLLIFSGQALAQGMMIEPHWTYVAGDKVNTIEPAEDGIYVGSDRGIKSIGYSKNFRWSYETFGEVNAISVGENILIGTSKGELKMLDKGGKILWEREMPGYIGYGGATDMNEAGIIAGSMDGYVYMFNTTSDYLWKRLIGSYVRNVRLLRDRIVAVSDRHVYFLDYDGTVRMSVNIPGRIRDCSILDDMIVIGMDDDIVYGYNLTGSLLWSFSAGERITGISVWEDIVVGTDRGRVMVADMGGRVKTVINASSTVSHVHDCRAGIVVATLDDRIGVYSRDGILRRYHYVEGRTTKVASRGDEIVSSTSMGNVYFMRVPVSDGLTSALVLAFAAFILVASSYIVARTWRS